MEQISVKRIREKRHTLPTFNLVTEFDENINTNSDAFNQDTFNQDTFNRDSFNQDKDTHDIITHDVITNDVIRGRDSSIDSTSKRTLVFDSRREKKSEPENVTEVKSSDVVLRDEF